MSRQLVKDYFSALKECLDQLPAEKITDLAEMIYQAYKQDKQIFVMGNGGSASTASHFACDINKCVSYGLKKRTKIISLSDNIPIMLAYANDLSYEDVFIEQLKNFFNRGDLVIGISGSGNSKNVLKAIQFANHNGGPTAGITGFDGGKLAKISQFSLVVPVNDMQLSEDLHLIVTHILMKILYKKLRA